MNRLLNLGTYLRYIYILVYKEKNKIYKTLRTYSSFLHLRTFTTFPRLVQLVENPGTITTGGSNEHLSQATSDYQTS